MSKPLEKRIDRLEGALMVQLRDEAIVALRDVDGLITDIEFRFSYRFNTAGDVVGIRVGERDFDRIRLEPISSLRRRAFDERAVSSIPLLREFMAGVCGKSRGLPGPYKAEARAWDKAICESVRADAKRRRREKELGARVISISALMMTHD